MSLTHWPGFYCRQAGHCGKGMTFSINPTAEKTQALFQAMAIQQNGQGGGSAITGNGGGAPAGAPAGAAPAAGSSSVVAGEGAAVTPTVGDAGSATVGTGGAVATNNVGSGFATGSGTINPDGSCSCAVICNAGSFPAVAQGNGAFGGFAGELPPIFHCSSQIYHQPRENTVANVSPTRRNSRYHDRRNVRGFRRFIFLAKAGGLLFAVG